MSKVKIMSELARFYQLVENEWETNLKENPIYTFVETMLSYDTNILRRI